MSKNCLKITGLSLLALCTATTGFADSKVRARYSSSGQSNETTIFTKGARQRLQYGTEMSAITQCDLKRMVQIMDKTKSYLVMPLDGNPGAPPSVAPAQTTAAVPTKRGLVTYNTTVTDTGERKQLFGYTARHLKIIVAKEVSPDACDQKKERIETDGWYIDFDQSFACAFQGTPGKPVEVSGCRDEIRQILNSKEKQGYPLSYVMTTYKEDGGVANSLTMETLEFSTTPLEAALFEVPAGYTEQDLQKVMAQGSGAGNSTSASGSVFDSSKPKQAGVLRIGVAEVGSRVGRPASTQVLKEQLRGFITEANVDAIVLAVGSPDQAAAEAQQKECDYILHTDIAELKKGKTGGFGGMMGKMSAVSGMGMAGEPPKEKFEAKTEFKLFPVGSTTPRLASSATGKTGGFSLKTAMNLATTAGSVASFAMMGGAMGFNPGIMNMFSSMSMMNRGYAGGMGEFGIDPTSRMIAMMQSANPAMFPAAPAAPQGPQLNPGEQEAVGESLQNVAKAVVTEVKKKK